MSEETVDKVIEQLDKVGELGGQALEIYTRQAIIEDIYGTAFGVLGLILLPTMIWLSVKFTQKSGNASYSEDEKYAAAAFACGVVALLSLVALITGTVYTMQLINPEYYAIQELIQQVR